MSFENIEEEIPLVYSIDHTILMHREAHFGGNFNLMLEYYRQGGRGICQEIDIARIEQLHLVELEGGKDLASLVLSAAEAEKIFKVRLVYKQLRALYEVTNVKTSIPILIADLILAEEEDISAVMNAVIAEKSAIVPALIDLLKNEEFYDPLFPGYGEAPSFAAICLGEIGDKRAIISLFESIGEGDFYSEDNLLHALHAIGNPAKEFLLRVLRSLPLNADNERAAIALIAFKDDPEVIEACIKMLETIDLKTNELLATYLLLVCEEVTSFDQQLRIKQLGEKKEIHKALQKEIQMIAKRWG